MNMYDVHVFMCMHGCAHGGQKLVYLPLPFSTFMFSLLSFYFFTDFLDLFLFFLPLFFILSFLPSPLTSPSYILCSACHRAG